MNGWVRHIYWTEREGSFRLERGESILSAERDEAVAGRWHVVIAGSRSIQYGDPQ